MKTTTTNNATEWTAQKNALEQKLRDLTGSSVRREDLQIEVLADDLDRVQSANERDLAGQRLNHQARIVREVKLALARISEGSYGICEECERPIAPRRLEAMPFARLCVRCQEEAEAAGTQGQENLLEEAA